MKKKILTCLLALAGLLPAWADRYTEQAEKHWKWIQAAQADSILAHATSELRAQLPAAMLQPLWSQLVNQCGALKKQEDWKVMEMQGLHICQKLLVFDQTALRLNLVLNDKLELSGLRFTPAPAPAETPKGEAAVLPPAIAERDFCVAHGKVSLPGTLTLPKAGGDALPAVVLVQGSGPSDRDTTIGPNKPFREWAHALAAQGIAVVRYDKRTKVYGYGIMEVCDGRLTYDTEVVDDAVQALKQVAQLDGIDPKRIFVLGHSLGGTLAPRIAEKSEVPLAGLIGVAAAARPFWEMVKEQLLYIGGTQGLDKEKAEKLAEEQMQAMKQQLPAEYTAFQAQYDPLQTARKLGKLPMLFVQGGHDYQVTETDFGLWRKALKGNPSARFELFPANDHLMRKLPQMAVPADYNRAEKTDAAALDRIAAFILGKE